MPKEIKEIVGGGDGEAVLSPDVNAQTPKELVEHLIDPKNYDDGEYFPGDAREAVEDHYMKN